MKRIVAGIVAHVDAGKTTLSEALLYRAGQIRKLGRVDHGDAFLDTNALEKRRGITIFAHQAAVEHGDLNLTLLDTPGHVDFAAETERVLRVLDYAILVVSATDGVQGHTETLWRLLARYGVPTFIFVNKCDADGADRDAVLAQLKRRLSDGCTAFAPIADGTAGEDDLENLAMQDEAAMDEFLEDGTLSEDRLRAMIAARHAFPVYFGSALKLEGVDEFLDGLERFTREPDWPAGFAAKVFKISHDEQKNRLTWLRVTGGTLRAKALLGGTGGDLAGSGDGTGGADATAPQAQAGEKADQLRVYNGAKFETVTEVPAGGVCAVAGPERTFPGEGLGSEPDAEPPSLHPVLTYAVTAPGGGSFDDLTLHRVLVALRELEDEEPLLDVAWQERLQEIHVQLMGSVQLEIIQQLMHDRFNLDVAFGAGSVLYKETITAPVEGVGHFEPLRHYAETHLWLEPAEPGSGMHFRTACSENVLARNWQRLILTHLGEREHVGVLTGSPLTDMTITLLTGKAHEKHTEGGDFRQATYRAIRQGLMESRAGVVGRPTDEQIAAGRPADGSEEDPGTDEADASKPAKASNSASKPADATNADADAPKKPVNPGNCRLLEPWYAFRLEVPADMIGRAMSDIQRMSGDFDPPQSDGSGEYATITGHAPVSEMRDYAMDVNAYTHGRGRLSATFGGYRPCHDESRVIAEAAYDPEADLENTPDSVFCAHGAGYPVKWYRVPDFMHLDWAGPAVDAAGSPRD
ncbi:TetM/TetW/TetO/TetS family tetracycline resistance ribosomal protection protein [Bifidobacterium vespertilionis]|uniref:TetM/TetW/TetO/TetS family tetracycline resistance ribosomal protection protein n=1 Tax=Bifidobacterium vespertilionis TaxID=2562524 RepID=A0A5J5DZA5_9BIFI|nr:TetM/TetW/TetO/TetS family tetracycline resistance ribosomal protection protein [Bifidobacterium vespertilionis]KAA8816870.1 TetM/TetW/TetO/TetS family tetracycline resistance ribosomal protection protein [Bifidobacterium vespertilionis]KAA8821869.1 TetM/TetW/TetO/TetS family tetracycline resistance ribosomal protection protein [Bifidobacterium vespertilionis]